MLEFIMGKKKKRLFKAPDAKRDLDQLARAEKQTLQEVLEDSSPGFDKLADLAQALKGVKKADRRRK
jgi:hypothetical protein